MRASWRRIATVRLRHGCRRRRRGLAGRRAVPRSPWGGRGLRIADPPECRCGGSGPARSVGVCRSAGRGSPRDCLRRGRPDRARSTARHARRRRRAGHDGRGSRQHETGTNQASADEPPRRPQSGAPRPRRRPARPRSCPARTGRAPRERETNRVEAAAKRGAEPGPLARRERRERSRRRPDRLARHRRGTEAGERRRSRRRRPFHFRRGRHPPGRWPTGEDHARAVFRERGNGARTIARRRSVLLPRRPRPDRRREDPARSQSRESRRTESRRRERRRRTQPTARARLVPSVARVPSEQPAGTSYARRRDPERT